MDIAVVGSSGLGPVIGVGAEPAALLTALPATRPDHVLLLAPRHLERRAREQAHVVVAADREVRVGVLAFDHHALALTLIAAAVLDQQNTPSGWSEPGAGVQLVHQFATRSRSILWHPRVLGLRRPAPSVGQTVAGLIRKGGYFAELGSDTGPTRGASGFGPDGEEELYVAGEAPGLLLTQLGDATVRTVAISSEPLAPYRTRHTVELCGLAGSAMPSLTQEACSVCGASRPPAGCLFCGSGVDARSLTPARSGSIGGSSCALDSSSG